MMMTLASGTPLPAPSKTFLRNLEIFNDQARHLIEGDEKLVGVTLEVVPKLFGTEGQRKA
jgi:hypothetical protein